ncbi:MBL fold metallo-hydrolase [Pseudomonas aeruginosa]|nr:MBL fold metallo-hydrolase [Pseudomonas aeruginosa]
MSVSIRFLHAFHGDCILITIGPDESAKRILIDGGPPSTFKAGPSGELRLALTELEQQDKYIDLVILTHVDDDHIGGLIKAFEAQDGLSKLAKKVIFNSGRLIHNYFRVAIDPEKDIQGNFSHTPETSIDQGDTLERLLENEGIWVKEVTKQGDKHNLDDVELYFLSPNENELRSLLGKWEKETLSPFTSLDRTDWNESYEDLLSKDSFREDTSKTNASSLAFILKVDGDSYIFLGDAHPSTVSAGLRLNNYTPETPIVAKLVKISHHGSKGNTNEELLSLLECSKFVISTDGSRHGLPDKVTLARIHKYKESAEIYFNYQGTLDDVYTESEQRALGNKVKVLDGELKFA